MNYPCDDDVNRNHSGPGDPILGQIRSQSLTNILIVVQKLDILVGIKAWNQWIDQRL